MALMLSLAEMHVIYLNAFWFWNCFRIPWQWFFFVESQKRGSGKQGGTSSMFVLFLNSHKGRCSTPLEQSISVPHYPYEFHSESCIWVRELVLYWLMIYYSMICNLILVRCSVMFSTSWTSSTQVEFCCWLWWGWLSSWGFTPGPEKRSGVRMDIWRTGSGKTSARHAVACLCPRGLQECHCVVGTGVALWGNSRALHIRSCHVALQTALTWPAPAQLRSEPSHICAGRAGPFGRLQKWVRNEL